MTNLSQDTANQHRTGGNGYIVADNNRCGMNMAQTGNHKTYIGNHHRVEKIGKI